MSRNYYDNLELPRTASYEQIAQAYISYLLTDTLRFKRLSLKFHPIKNPADLATNSVRFAELCEAYEVLSNRKFLT